MPPNMPGSFVRYKMTKNRGKSMLFLWKRNTGWFRTEDHSVLEFCGKSTIEGVKASSLTSSLQVVEEMISSKEEKMLLESINWIEDTDKFTLLKCCLSHNVPVHVFIGPWEVNPEKDISECRSLGDKKMKGWQGVKKWKTCQWLMPIILATREAEIRRITVRSQPRQIILWDPISKQTHHKKKDWWSGSSCRPWVQALVPKKTSERGARDSSSCL
jgi:hypothetical protein